MSKKFSIALIDDDEAVLDSLRLYFATTGHDVACFGDAAGLLKALATGLKPDCIVSDIRMPAYRVSISRRSYPIATAPSRSS